MATKTTLVCDVCEEEIPDPETATTVRVLSLIKHHGRLKDPQDFDACQTCMFAGFVVTWDNSVGARVAMKGNA